MTFDAWAQQEIATARDVAEVQGLSSIQVGMLWHMPVAVRNLLTLFPGIDIPGAILDLVALTFADDRAASRAEEGDSRLASETRGAVPASDPGEEPSFKDWAETRVHHARELAEEQGTTVELAMYRSVHIHVLAIQLRFPDLNLSVAVQELGELARSEDAETSR